MSKNHGNHGSSESFEDRVDSLKDSVRGLAEIGSERAHVLKDKVSDVSDTARSTAEAWMESAKKLIVANPIAAVAIAFGIGYVAMRIARR